MESVSGTFFLLLVHLFHFSCSSISFNSQPIRNMKDMFIGRCEYYQRVLHRRRLESDLVDCNSYWKKFESIQNQDKCSWSMADYEEVTDMIKLDIPKDKGVLWSQTAEFVSKITFQGYRLHSIANSLIGYPLDAIYWCSDKEGTGCSQRCTDCSKLPFAERSIRKCGMSKSMGSYWDQASKLFASSLEGRVSVMLNNTNWKIVDGKPKALYPYFSGTTFGRVEIHALDPSKVTVLQVILVQNPGSKITEDCEGKKSLYLIKKQMEKKGIKYECVVNPPFIKYMLCVDNPTAAECQGSRIDLQRSSSSRYSGATTVIGNWLCILTLAVGVLERTRST